MKDYFNELKRAMNMLATHPDTLFLGQAVASEGTAIRGTLADVPESKLLEMPVCEDMQMGITNGLSLSGKIPISIFPRWNFLLLATNQIVNHLENIPKISKYKTKVIIRTSIGSETPLYPGHQHVGDHTDAFRKMVNKIDIIRLDKTKDVYPSYSKALNRKDGKSTLLVEWGDGYNEDWEVSA